MKRPAMTAARHIVLLGDSIFDNTGYVPGGPDVVNQLRALLPGGWRATLNAVDGSVAGDVKRQIGWLGSDVTHLVVSVGGNDALGYSSLLDEGATSVAEALLSLSEAADRFAENYRAMLDGILARRLQTAVCTIYDPRFPDPIRRRIATAALTLFNDVITREAFARKLPLIDLRLICNDDGDFANPIEPSVQGGEKIAAAIMAFAKNALPGNANSEVFAS
jgi:lysophospholipase L1-like esterase